MLKTGIVRRRDLSLHSVGTFFGRRRFIAVTLYPVVAAEEGPEAQRLLGHILRRFPGPGGTYKRTQRGRFQAFDRDLVALLARHRGRERLRIHDLAVSDGGTAVDLFEQLVRLGVDIEFTASDLAPDVLAIAAPPSSLAVVLDASSANVLQVIRPPFVFNVEKRESALFYPINRALLAILLRSSVRRLVDRYRSVDPAVVAQAIRLIAPEARRLEKTDPRFAFVRHDVLQPLPGRYDVVRAMNILNPAYFSAAGLATAVGHIRDALDEGGLFVTGSNQDVGSVVDGAIYERSGEGFRLLVETGEGSPIASVIG